MSMFCREVELAHILEASHGAGGYGYQKVTIGNVHYYFTSINISIVVCRLCFPVFLGTKTDVFLKELRQAVIGGRTARVEVA